MKLVFLVSLPLLAHSYLSTSRIFDQFRQKFHKAYPSAAELDYRRRVFEYNVQLIEQANRMHDPYCPNSAECLLKEAGYGAQETDLTLRFALNDNADLTQSEFASQYLMTARAHSAWSQPMQAHSGFYPAQPKGFWPSRVLPQTWPGSHAQQPQPAAAQVDHSVHFQGYKIKNQRNCGACWAASAATVVEMAHYLAHSSLVYLSYQELLDCCTQGSLGCSGGQAVEALEYIQQRGVLYEQYLPYEARQGACSPVPRAQGSLSSLLTHPRRAWHTLTRPAAAAEPGATRYFGVRQIIPLGAGVEAIVRALARNAVIISINTSPLLRFYSSGVFESADCRSGVTDHHLVAVGYNLGGPRPYLKVLNSWGATWGMGGYGLVAVYTAGPRMTSVCGLDTDPANYQVEV